METLAKSEDKIYGAMTIYRAGEFVAPFKGNPFPCLIWDHDGRFADPERSEVARSLLEAGCRYAVCAGANCEAWHDAVDAEFATKHGGESEQVQARNHIMTSWHDEESPDEVALFFVLDTNFDDHNFAHYLVLHVGTGTAKELVDTAVRKYALGQ